MEMNSSLSKSSKSSKNKAQLNSIEEQIVALEAKLKSKDNSDDSDTDDSNSDSESENNDDGGKIFDSSLDRLRFAGVCHPHKSHFIDRNTAPQISPVGHRVEDRYAKLG